MITVAAPADLPEIRRLWDTCFPDDTGFNEYFFSCVFHCAHTLLVKKDGILCAMLQMLPYQLQVAGQPTEVTYIYGACTAPASRRKGYMACLLEHAFALDRAAGRAASVLIPQEQWLFDFYQPFGYQPFFQTARMILQKQAAPVTKQSKNPTDLPRRLTQQDIPQMQALYEKLSPACHMLRSAAIWQQQLALFDQLGKGVYGWFAGDGQLSAYAFCWQDTVQEAFGMTEAQAQGLLQTLDKESLPCVSYGIGQSLGCVKWHREAAVQIPYGYMNLMLN